MLKCPCSKLFVAFENYEKGDRKVIQTSRSHYLNSLFKLILAVVYQNRVLNNPKFI